MSIFDDGTQQCFPEATAFADRWPPDIFIERVLGEGSRRKQWHIVDRRGKKGECSIYPPTLAGPFPTLDGAKVALLLMKAAGDLDS